MSAIPPSAHPVISIDGEEPEGQVVARPRVARAAVDEERQKAIDVEVLPDVDVDVPVKLEEQPEEVEPLVQRRRSRTRRRRRRSP